MPRPLTIDAEIEAPSRSVKLLYSGTRTRELCCSQSSINTSRCGEAGRVTPGRQRVRSCAPLRAAGSVRAASPPHPRPDPEHTQSHSTPTAHPEHPQSRRQPQSSLHSRAMQRRCRSLAERGPAAARCDPRLQRCGRAAAAACLGAEAKRN